MAESIKKFIIKDAHGGTKESGSFSVVGEVHVNIVPGYGEPYADSVYVNGILTITIHNIEGNGITEITTDSQEGDEAVNTVTIKTNANPEGVTLEVRNGSRGNGIASISEVLSPEDGGTNTHTITDTDGNEHVIHTVNGHTGPQGIPGEGAIWTGEGEEIMTLAQETGSAINKAMSQKAVTDGLNNIVKSSVNGTTVAYPGANDTSGVQSNVTINASTGYIETTSAANDKVFFNAVKFNKGDIIQITGSGSTARILQFGFTTTDPASLNTLVGLQLTNVVATSSATSFSLELIAPYDNAYLLYHRYSSYTVNFTRWSLSSIKNLPTAISNNKMEVEMATAAKTEKDYDLKTNGYLDSNGDKANTSNNQFLLFYVDSEYSSVKVRTFVASGRALAFYSDHNISSSSLIQLVGDMYTYPPVWRTFTIPTGTKMIAVNYPIADGQPTIDVGVVLGKSSSYFGYYDRKIATYDTNALRVTPQGFTLWGGGSSTVNRIFYTIPGHRYRIRRSAYTWDMSGITSDSTEVIGLYSVTGGNETKIYRRTKAQMASDIFPLPYDFTAESVGYYKLNFKATSGTSVTFDIEDITEIIPYEGRGVADIIQLNGGTGAARLRMINIAVAGGLRFLYLSDAHTGTNAVAEALRWRQYAGYIDDIISGGDNVYDQPTDAYVFANAKTVMTVVGNHDVYSGETKLTSKQVFDIYYGEHTTHWTGVTFPTNYQEDGLCYWYKDYATQKVRVVGLDCINWTNAQGTWLEGVLESARTNNYHVVIVMHYKPKNFTGVRICTFNSLIGMSAQYADESINNIVATAIGNGLQFVCYLFGHEHRSYFGYVSNHTDQWAFAAAKPLPPIGTNDSDRRNVGSSDVYGTGAIHNVHYSLYIINVDTTRGVIAISTLGNNRDMYERPMNNLVFDYINHQILSNT